MICIKMEESEGNMSSDGEKMAPSSEKPKPKKRSLVERELETSLTAHVTCPATLGDGSSTSRYGRARRVKIDSDFCNTEKAMSMMLKSPKHDKTPIAYKMHASNSLVRVESTLQNQIENIYSTNIMLSRFGADEKPDKSPSPAAKKYPKTYVRADLIQTKEKEEPVTLIKNMFSPNKPAYKPNNHLSNVLDRSSEKYVLNNSGPEQNGYVDKASIVKTLDLDSKHRLKTKQATIVKTLDFDIKNKRRDRDTVPVMSKSELFELEAKCEYQVGDLAWARMGTYPFWPCIVTREPTTKLYVKRKLFGRIERDMINVTFFGDNGRRSWIVNTMLRPFQGLKEFEATRDQFKPEDKKKDPRLYQAFFISDKKQTLWLTSVEEAETFMKEPKRLRIDLLHDLLEKSNPKMNSKSQKKVVRADSDFSLSESLLDTLFSEDGGKSDDPDHAKKERKNSLDVSEVVTACLDNMAARTGLTQIQKQSHMDRWLQKAKSKIPKLEITVKVEEVDETIEGSETKCEIADKNDKSESKTVAKDADESISKTFVINEDKSKIKTVANDGDKSKIKTVTKDDDKSKSKLVAESEDSNKSNTVNRDEERRSKKEKRPNPASQKPYSLRKSTGESQNLLLIHNEHDYSAKFNIDNNCHIKLETIPVAENVVSAPVNESKETCNKIDGDRNENNILTNGVVGYQVESESTSDEIVTEEIQESIHCIAGEEDANSSEMDIDSSLNDNKLNKDADSVNCDKINTSSNEIIPCEDIIEAAIVNSIINDGTSLGNANTVCVQSSGMIETDNVTEENQEAPSENAGKVLTQQKENLSINDMSCDDDTLDFDNKTTFVTDEIENNSISIETDEEMSRKSTEAAKKNLMEDGKINEKEDLTGNDVVDDADISMVSDNGIEKHINETNVTTEDSTDQTVELLSKNKDQETVTEKNDLESGKPKTKSNKIVSSSAPLEQCSVLVVPLNGPIVTEEENTNTKNGPESRKPKTRSSRNGASPPVVSDSGIGEKDLNKTNLLTEVALQNNITEQNEVPLTEKHIEEAQTKKNDNLKSEKPKTKSFKRAASLGECSVVVVPLNGPKSAELLTKNKTEESRMKTNDLESEKPLRRSIRKGTSSPVVIGERNLNGTKVMTETGLQKNVTEELLTENNVEETRVKINDLESEKPQRRSARKGTSSPVVIGETKVVQKNISEESLSGNKDEETRIKKNDLETKKTLRSVRIRKSLHTASDSGIGEKQLNENKVTIETVLQNSIKDQTVESLTENNEEETRIKNNDLEYTKPLRSLRIAKSLEITSCNQIDDKQLNENNVTTTHVLQNSVSDETAESSTENNDEETKTKINDLEPKRPLRSLRIAKLLPMTSDGSIGEKQLNENNVTTETVLQNSIEDQTAESLTENKEEETRIKNNDFESKKPLRSVRIAKSMQMASDSGENPSEETNLTKKAILENRIKDKTVESSTENADEETRTKKNDSESEKPKITPASKDASPMIAGSGDGESNVTIEVVLPNNRTDETVKLSTGNSLEESQIKDSVLESEELKKVQKIASSASVEECSVVVVPLNGPLPNGYHENVPKDIKDEVYTDSDTASTNSEIDDISLVELKKRTIAKTGSRRSLTLNKHKLKEKLVEMRETTSQSPLPKIVKVCSEEIELKTDVENNGTVVTKRVLRPRIETPVDSLNPSKESSPERRIKEETDFETASVTSEGSNISTKRRNRAKDKVSEEDKMKDPDFVRYLELRQDALIDEQPELTHDEIVAYLYKTWQYEEARKSDIVKNHENEETNIVKGSNPDAPQVKKKKRAKPDKNKLININKVFKKELIEEFACIPAKDKPKRKTSQPCYVEDLSDIEEEIKMFEIFKQIKDKAKTPEVTAQKDVATASTSTTASTIEIKEQITEIIEEQTPEEYHDEVEAYFEDLVKPKPNVFKGLVREKVCEICEKTSNLVKCKGCHSMFHIECVKKETEIVDEPVFPRGRKKRKKPKGRRPKSSIDSNGLDESHSEEKSQDVSVTESKSVEEILDESNTVVVDADVFETQLAAKMKEMIEIEDKIEFDSYSSDDCLDWRHTIAGKCEIVDVKLKSKRPEIDQSNFKCNNCQKDDVPLCFVCKSPVSPKAQINHRPRCQVAHCHKFYHLECLEYWPQTQFNTVDPSKNKGNVNEHSETLTCPRHVCHTCVCDDPRGCKTRFSGDKLARCVRCPATYHSFTKCLPAGTQILTASHIICPRHYEHRPGKVPCHVNTGWCFICALGGTLICCEYCPTSFHAECLQIDPPDGGYMCEDCETGRLPLYGEMVWVKLGHYRWWPGIVLHPYQIPSNIMAVKHSPGEFVVRFFGQYDHYWVNRGRVFPYQEGDSGRISGQKSKIDEAFTKAMEHAQRAYEILKTLEENEEECPDIASSLLPPHYVKLKTNKPYGNVMIKREVEESSLTQCDCDPNDVQPCGPLSHCLNRILLTECGPSCRAVDRCNNRAFERREYPRLTAYRTKHRGWGLKALEDIKAGQFVIEYVGELIDEEEFRRRMHRKHEMRDENFYFLTLDKERMIDAGPKGNLARFMNHCCEPNCETQKWTVLGDIRVGLFALKDIPANSELTFNYNLECAGIEKKRCMCGAKRCSGYIGAKPKQIVKEEKEPPKKPKLAAKRTYKKRTPEEKALENNKQKRPVGRPPKPRELTDIEKDLLIIKNAINGISSDSEGSGRLSSIDVESERKDIQALKRKRVSFSSEDAIDSKRLKLDDEKTSSEVD